MRFRTDKVPPRVSRRSASLATLMLVGLLAAACTPSARAECSDPMVTIEVTVSDSAMEPSAISACRGQAVTLAVASETAGLFHIHGYDDQVPAVALEPGESRTLAFTADVPGQFIVELHAVPGQESVEIGVLTVNEP